MVGTSFGTPEAVYSLLLPLALLQFFALLFIPSILLPGTKPPHVAKAIYCYLLQTVGVLLMSGSGIPAIYAVVTQTEVGGRTYLALLLLFLAGGITFLWHEHLSLQVEKPSRAVPFA